MILTEKDAKRFDRIPVDRVMQAISFPVEEKPLFFRDPSTNTVKQSSHKVIVRSDDGTECGTVSNGYQLVHHAEALDKAITSLQNQRYGFNRFTIDKGRVLLDAVAYESPIRIGRDDYLPRVILQNSYDGSGAIRIQRGLYRVICANGAMAALASGRHTFSVRHTKNAPVTLEEWTIRMREQNWIEELQFTMRQLDAPLEKEAVVNVLAKYFKAEKKSNQELMEDKRIIDVIQRAYFGDGQSQDLDKPLTKADIYNGITEYIRDTVNTGKVSSMERAITNTHTAFRLLIAA